MKLYKGDRFLVLTVFGMDWFAGWARNPWWGVLSEPGVLWEAQAGRVFVGWTR